MHSVLSVDDSSQYEVVTSAIVKAYELVPEADLQKFCSTAKVPTISLQSEFF